MGFGEESYYAGLWMEDQRVGWVVALHPYIRLTCGSVFQYIDFLSFNWNGGTHEGSQCSIRYRTV